MSLSPNSLLAHYKVISKIGTGGMGEVYLAYDTKLDRKVALKILPVDFGEDDMRMGRFMREAKSVSALNHPNILTIHEIGEADNQHYIATEFIDGKTLRNLIEPKPLSLSRCLEIASQVSAALNAAHHAGIVHRDIKPENIMVRSDGLVKVLDFGLAKSTVTGGSDPEGQTKISETQPGMILGTVAYMSPEQARGQSVDVRSDVWSLGVVIYEMLTGRKPFSGATVTDTLANILHQESDLSAIQAISPHLAQILSKLLAKKPEERYQSIGEAVVALKNLQRRNEYQSQFEPHSTDQTRSEDQTQVILSSTHSRAIESVADSGPKRAAEGFWIAVLPFKYRGSNFDLEVLAEGISEDIITGLSHFSYLRVISRSSTLRFSGEALDIRTVGKELGARYVIEGSLRQAGSMLRLAVQLIDANTGVHLWAENYNRALRAEAVFELQDELVPRIVSTVADSHGVLPRSMSDAVQNRTPEELSPYEAVLRSFNYAQKLTPEALADAVFSLELAVQKAPTYADAWSMLGVMLVEDYAQGYNVRADSLAQAEKAARRAVDLAPSNHWAWASLARVHFFKKEPQSFRNAVERAVALNTMDGDSHASLGEMLTFSGDAERGLQLVERAKQLNPNHPGWYWYANFYQAYKERDYRAALNFALKVNLPGHWAEHLLTAAARGQLGEIDLAAKAVGELLRIRPNVGTTVRKDFMKWWSVEDAEHLLDGLRKAGLECVVEKGQSGDDATERSRDEHVALPTTQPVTNSSISSHSSGSIIKSIAILPFKNLSGDSEQEFFADGITEDILNALAQIQGLRVAGRSSSFSFKGRNEDLRSIGAKLNVGTILEGTLRRSGDRLRITAQLIDASNGYQLWSERYDRVIDDIFSVQDEIASTLAGRLQLSFSEEPAGDQPPTRNIEAYELYLKGRALLYQRGLSITKAIDCFNQAVALDPSYAQAWAGLADGYTTSGYSGLKRPEEAMPRAIEAAKRALELDPSLAESHNAIACATLLWEKDYELAEREFETALSLNPNYSQAIAWYGLFFLQWVSGRDREALREMLRMVGIDPWSAYTNVIFCFSAISSGRIGEAVEHGQRGVELDPQSYLAQWCLAVALEYAGRYEEANAAVERALGLSGRHGWAMMTLASNYAAWGHADKAQAAFLEFVARSTCEYVQPAMLAAAAASIGEIDRALEFAQQALEIRDPMFLMLARSWPDFENLRKDSRFLEIVAQLNLPGWNDNPQPR